MKSKYNCTNTQCYITDEPLSPNETFEHIIPNALGGFLKSNKLILSRINTGLFDKLYAELADRIEIAHLFKFKRDRGQQPPIKGTTKDGIEYLMHEGSKVSMLSRKPDEVQSETGEPLLKFPLHQKQEIIAARLKKNPKLNKEELEKSIIEEHNEGLDTLYYKHNLNIIVNSFDSFRAVAKIATNYAVLNNFNKTLFVDFINFIKGEDNLHSIHLGYFYPKNFLNYEIGSKEVSHILYLKACNREKLLYCYIELFNLHCFIVILNYDYHGENFTVKYIWDVQAARELNKDISLNVTSDFLASRDYMYYPEVEKDYTERLMRLAEVLNLRIKR
ncbi:MAG: hypothetical protein ABIN97_11265 [Ginsengibacter sp.]